MRFNGLGKDRAVRSWFVRVSAVWGLCAFAVAAQPENLDLYLLIGQSNMAGRGVVTDADKQTHPRIWMLNRENQWIPAQDPVHFDKSIAGVGLCSEFARREAAAHPQSVIGLVPCAFGGSSIQEWQPGKKHYQNTVVRMKAAMKNGKLKAILWHQGEANSGNAAKIAEYPALFQNMISSLRKELDAESVPVLVGELGHYKANYLSFNKVLPRVVAETPHSALVTAEGLFSNNDIVHFDRESLFVFGTRYQEALETLRKGAPKVSPEVVTWRAAEGTKAEGDFQVRVNGKPLDVQLVPTPTHTLEGEEAHSYSFAQFDCAVDVTVEVTTTQSVENVRILPLAKGIKAEKKSAHSISFTAKPPFQLAIEPEGRHHALILAANLPETEVPKADDPSVVYFGPGRHKPGVITLKDNQTLYLAGGAWVEGAVRASGTNLTIRGRGVLSGAPWPWVKGPSGHMVGIYDARNVVVKDITLHSAWTWCLVLANCQRALIDNVKILGGRVLNDDGMDVCDCKDVEILRSFIRSQDDCFAWKLIQRKKLKCENIYAHDCTLWTDVANAFRIGYENAGTGFRNLLFKDLDILHLTLKKRDPETYWAHCGIVLQPSNGQTMERLLFEDIRFDTAEPGDIFLYVNTRPYADGSGKYTVGGILKGCTIRNVQLPPSNPPSPMVIYLNGVDPDHPIEDLVLENVSGFGKVIRHGTIKGEKGL